MWFVVRKVIGSGTVLIFSFSINGQAFYFISYFVFLHVLCRERPLDIEQKYSFKDQNNSQS